MRRIYSAAFVAALLAVLISGCGQRNAKTTTDRKTATRPAPTTATSAGSPAREAEKSSSAAKPAKTNAVAQGLPTNPTAKDILLRSAAVYKSVKTLKIAGSISQSFKMGGKHNNQRSPLAVQFARPNKLRLQYGGGKQYLLIVSDGSKQIVYDSRARIYRTGPAPKDLAEAAMAGGQGISTMTLLSGQNVSPYLKNAKLVGSEKVVGIDTYVINFPVASPGMPGMTSEQRLWIGKTDLLIHQIETIRTASAKALAAHMTGHEKVAGPMVVTEKTVMTSIAVDGPVPASSFRFTPPAGAQAFKPQPTVPGHPDIPKPPDVTGNKAPDFRMPSIEGKEVSLSSFKGKPVLVVFWTSLSGASKEGMVALQKMQDELRSKGVSTVAITLDAHKANDEKFVKDNGITFPVLMGYDTASDTARKFGLLYLPSVFIVDGQGIIRGNATGSDPSAGIWSELAKIGVR